MNRETQNKSYESRKGMYDPLHLTVATTTGARFQLSVSALESVSGLKSALARRFRLQADRMSLLYKDRLLLHGSLVGNQVCSGSQLTLIPNMETGSNNMSSNSRVMQALENLTESQVNDFLTGRSPLLLAMKLGEHMMFVQLQLSSSSCNSRRRSPPQSLSNPSHRSHPDSSSNKRSSHCTCTPPPTPPPTTPNSNSGGAIIDSVNHLGKGVYSGTFSGTLDPSIQDPLGHPKRDINTIMQILNDLLVASPQLGDTPANIQKSFDKQAMHSSPISDQSMDLEYTTDGERLRGKVQTLQKMMQERKMRRQEKRGLRAPYQWPDRSSNFRQCLRTASRVNYESSLAREREMTGKSDSHTPAEASFALEHESVLV